MRTFSIGLFLLALLIAACGSEPASEPASEPSSAPISRPGQARELGERLQRQVEDLAPQPQSTK